MRQRIGFLLLPRFSLLSLASASAVLRAGNDCLGGRALEVLLLSRDGRPVRASGDEMLSVGAAFDDVAAPMLGGLVIVADAPPTAADQGWITRTLAAVGQRIDRARGMLCGIDSGAAWLGRAGLLQGFRATVKAEYCSEVAAACPGAIVSARHYELDRNRLSCAGGTSAIDLMIHWLEQSHGERLGRQLLLHFGMERLRSPGDQLLLPTSARLSASTKLAEAVALMEANLGEPLSTEDIAGLVGVSRRQLERLFKQHLDTLPSRWYLEQRLQRAQRLLQQGSQSILQIGLSCGFTSGAHFSNAYRNCFGRTPRDERSARANAWRDAGSNRDHTSNTPEPDKDRT
jgi:transcriptional regulator GlxA family with amidase domain